MAKNTIWIIVGLIVAVAAIMLIKPGGLLSVIDTGPVVNIGSISFWDVYFSQGVYGPNDQPVINHITTSGCPNRYQFAQYAVFSTIDSIYMGGSSQKTALISSSKTIILTAPTTSMGLHVVKSYLMSGSCTTEDYQAAGYNLKTCGPLTYKYNNQVWTGEISFMNAIPCECLSNKTWQYSGQPTKYGVPEIMISDKCSVQHLYDAIGLSKATRTQEYYVVDESKIEYYESIIQDLNLTVAQQLQYILLFNQTIIEQAKNIQAMNLTVQQQAGMIESLGLTIDQQAHLISEMQLTVDEQAELIANFSVTIDQQAEYISALNLTVLEQAQIINHLAQNLEEKAALIDQLAVTTQQQADLIAQMRLSFADQGAIISQLNNTVAEDATLIKQLTSSNSEQAEIITNMKLTNQQQADIISKMNLSLQDQARIINEMKLTNEQQAAIIRALKLSNDDQARIIANMKKTNEEQVALISKMQLTLEQQKALLNATQYYSKTTQTIDPIWLIVGGLAIAALFFIFGRKTRRR